MNWLWLKDKRIMRRFTIAMMLTSGVALALAGVAFVANDYVQLRAIYQRQLSNTAAIVAASVVEPLATANDVAAAKTIDSLRNDPSILAALVYRKGDEKPIAAYFRPGADTALPQMNPGMYRENGSILLIRDVMAGSDAVGRLAIRVDSSDIGPLLGKDTSMALGVIATCILIALIFTRHLRRMIAEPLVVLAESAALVPVVGNARRIERAGGDEIEVLTDAFSVLLGHVKKQEASLADYRQQLESAAERESAVLESGSEEIRNALLQADRVAGSRAAFLARVSESMRPSLTLLAETGRIVADTNLTAEQRDLLSTAGDAAADLMKLVDDLADFSRIEAGELQLRREDFGLADVLYEVLRVYSPAARQKGLTLSLEIAREVPATVRGDQTRLRQIVSTLLSNALKFTDVGKVAVEVMPVYQSGRDIGIHFRVRDTGRGISEEEFERAVEPFGGRADPAAARSAQAESAGSTGLSLAIANRLVGLMGGSFWMESEVGWGSSFHFTATFEAVTLSPVPDTERTILAGLSVLIADAGQVTRRQLEQVFLRWQMKPTFAATGEEAVRLLRRAASARMPFSIALVDSEMRASEPGAGSDLLSEIQSHPELGAPELISLVPVNSVTVSDVASGFGTTGYLVKPISQTMLLRTLLDAARRIQGERLRPAQTAGEKEPAATRGHILVAEGNVLTQAIAVSLLIREGYEITLARTGAQAVEACERGGVDLVLLDLRMPDLTGIEATQLIRQQESAGSGRVPIIGLTDRARPQERERCIDAGMDDYLAKPFQARDLERLLDRWLRPARSTRRNTTRE